MRVGFSSFECSQCEFVCFAGLYVFWNFLNMYGLHVCILDAPVLHLLISDAVVFNVCVLNARILDAQILNVHIVCL